MRTAGGLTSSSTNCCTLLTPTMFSGLPFSHQGSLGIELRLEKTTTLLRRHKRQMRHESVDATACTPKVTMITAGTLLHEHTTS